MVPICTGGTLYTDGSYMYRGNTLMVPIFTGGRLCTDGKGHTSTECS